MNVRIIKVGNYSAIRSGQPSGSYFPFGRNGPVQNLGSGGHFMDPEIGEMPMENGKRLTHAVTGDAASYREEFGG